MSVRGPNNVGRAVQTDPTLLRYASAITEQKKCWELLAENFDLFQTLRNNTQQHPTTCNIQQCWELLANNVASFCTGLYSNKLSKNMTPCKLMRFLLLLIFTFMRFLGAAVKEGIPSDDDLELLSVKVEKWKPLGRRLKLEAAELTALHQENEELSEKVFAMLIKWKQKMLSRLLTVVYMTPSVIN